MLLLLATEAHFYRGWDGHVYAEGPEDYPLWSSYRDGFEQVGVLARVDSRRVRPAGRRADGAGVVFFPLADYRGPWEYLRRLPQLRKDTAEALRKSDLVLLRVPGAVGYLAWHAAVELAKPYAIEVLGDPWESLGPIQRPPWFQAPWRPFARRWSRHNLRRMCSQARVACYVTRTYLQGRYPPGGRRVFTCSDVRLHRLATEAELEERWARIRQAAAGKRPWQLGFAGSLETMYKAPDVHLEAVRLCRDRIDLRLAIAGDGRRRASLERLAARLGISREVRFLGALPPGRAVEQFLDGIDLFVLASHTEGMPRALIEAMARGCPAVGSRVGGIPELLDAECLVAPGSPEAVAEKFLALLGKPERLIEFSRRNHAVGDSFTREALEPVRREFLRELRRQAEKAHS